MALAWRVVDYKVLNRVFPSCLQQRHNKPQELDWRVSEPTQWRARSMESPQTLGCRTAPDPPDETRRLRCKVLLYGFCS